MEEDTAAVDAEEKQAGWFATNMERLDEFNRQRIKLSRIWHETFRNFLYKIIR